CVTAAASAAIKAVSTSRPMELACTGTGRTLVSSITAPPSCERNLAICATEIDYERAGQVAPWRRSPTMIARARKPSRAARRPRLGALRGLRLERILGPVVPGITAAHVFAHVHVSVPPEAREIARHLQRPMCGRQQLERDRYGASAYARRRGEPEHFLHPHGSARSVIVAVVD